MDAGLVVGLIAIVIAVALFLVNRYQANEHARQSGDDHAATRGAVSESPRLPVPEILELYGAFSGEPKIPFPAIPEQVIGDIAEKVRQAAAENTDPITPEQIAGLSLAITENVPKWVSYLRAHDIYAEILYRLAGVVLYIDSGFLRDRPNATQLGDRIVENVQLGAYQEAIRPKLVEADEIGQSIMESAFEEPTSQHMMDVGTRLRTVLPLIGMLEYAFLAAAFKEEDP